MLKYFLCVVRLKLVQKEPKEKFVSIEIYFKSLALITRTHTPVVYSRLNFHLINLKERPSIGGYLMCQGEFIWFPFKTTALLTKKSFFHFIQFDARRIKCKKMLVIFPIQNFDIEVIFYAEATRIRDLSKTHWKRSKRWRSLLLQIYLSRIKAIHIARASFIEWNNQK